MNLSQDLNKMTDFSNRIAAQREVLRIVNAKQSQGEQLFGLSRKAIDRWASSNRLLPSSNLVTLVERVSAQLFFLANKSQQHITEDEVEASEVISKLTEEIAEEMNCAA